jgi:hypothetical protein
MARTIPLSTDLITGEVAPIGEIRGFARPSIRSAWPAPRGPFLTDRKIALYKKQGFYASNVETIREKQARSAKRTGGATAKVLLFD